MHAKIDIFRNKFSIIKINENKAMRVQKLTTGLLASAGGLITNRFTGPGRIGIQSL